MILRFATKSSKMDKFKVKMAIKPECKTINVPLPTIDAENGGISVSAHGCEQYMSILRYGQYGQVGADGVWRNKEKDNKKSGDKKPTIKIRVGEVI